MLYTLCMVIYILYNILMKFSFDFVSLRMYKKQVHEKYAYNCYEKLWFFRCFSAFLTQYPSHPQIKTGGHIFSILFWENSSGSWGCLFTSCLSYVKNNIERNIDRPLSSLLLVKKDLRKYPLKIKLYCPFQSFLRTIPIDGSVELSPC